MKIKSHAKVNLWLDVTGKRADGYHTLNTLMCRVGLHDTVTLETGGEGIRVRCDHPGIPGGAGNLVHRAADLFYRRLGKEAAVEITVKKRIPVGAGLGGGSSNAAAVLTGLNRLCGGPFSIRQLREMGVTIGADVPFFIGGGPAVATGIGEVLTPFGELPPWNVVLIYPGFGVSTAEVFKKLRFDLTKPENKSKGTSLNSGDYQKPYAGPFDTVLHLRNDLEPVTVRLHPAIEEAKASLLTRGAAGALMSGSGSVVFGLFTGEGEAGRAAEALAAQGSSEGWEVHLTDLVLEGD